MHERPDQAMRNQATAKRPPPFGELAEAFTLLYLQADPEVRTAVYDMLAPWFKAATITDAQEGRACYQSGDYDLIIADISLPESQNLPVVETIRAHDADQEIIVICACEQPQFLQKTIRLGIDGYIAQPIDTQQIDETLGRILLKLRQSRENRQYQLQLASMVEEKIVERHRLELEMIDNYRKTIHSLVELIEMRDSYTGGHSTRVADYSRRIAKAMGYDEETCQDMFRAGILHDIGKIATPDAVLLKPGKLTRLEYRLIKEHVTVGADMLAKIPMYKKLSEIIIGHHEHYDGSGYPKGTAGEAIHPLSRIMMVADAFDAMTTNRIYKGRKTVDAAVEEIRSLSGIHFHPEVVEAALPVLREAHINQAISQMPATELEKERFAFYYKDSVTGVYNQNYLDMLLARNRFEPYYQSVQIIFLHNFSACNRQKGWQYGDSLLRSFAGFLQQKVPKTPVCRVHGDDFALLYPNGVPLDPHELDDYMLLQSNAMRVTSRIIDIEEERIHGVLELEKFINA